MTHTLGRLREHDERSRDYRLSPRRVTRLRPVTHYNAGPHLDQGNLGACVGFSVAEWLNTGRALASRKRFHRVTDQFYWDRRRYVDTHTAQWFYEKATVLDQFPGAYPPEDTGSSTLGAAKALKEAGAISSYQWTFTWDDYLAALQTQPVIIGIDWYASMFDLDNGTVIEPSQDDSPVGGHAIMAYAYQPATSKHPARTGCTNHWKDWGIRIGKHAGSFWINDDLLRELLIHQRGESLVPTTI